MNEIACRISFTLSRLGIQKVWHLPTFVAIEPANYCMLQCPQCPVGMRMSQDGEHAREVMSVELCRKIVDEIGDYAHTIIFHFQGEPLLNTHLAEMVAYAHEKKLYTMLSTNAQLLTEDVAHALASSGLDQLIVSVDGLTQSTYEHYRVGGKLEKALAGIRAMASIPRSERPEIVLQCLYLRTNEHEWDTIKAQYKELGADKLEMKTAQFYGFENGHADMPTQDKYSRYRLGSDGRYHIKNALHNRCYRLWSGCVITTDGSVLPCCYDKNHSFSYGNVASASFLQIWTSEQAQTFRDHVLRSRASIEMCGNCLE